MPSKQHKLENLIKRLVLISGKGHNLESSFDVQIKYPVADGIKTIDTVGPGSYFIEATGAGFSSIRIKSHSVPITVRIEYPKE